MIGRGHHRASHYSNRLRIIHVSFSYTHGPQIDHQLPQGLLSHGKDVPGCSRQRILPIDELGNPIIGHRSCTDERLVISRLVLPTQSAGNRQSQGTN